MDSLTCRDQNNWQRFIRVAYRNQPLDHHEIVRDVRGETISDDWRPALGILLVFDPWPHANWGHECWVAGLDIADNPITDKFVERQFPPEEDATSHFVPFATYRATGKLDWNYTPKRSHE